MLADLCGIGMPAQLDGRSFAPLFSDPEQPWKDAVWTVVSRANTFKATERLDPAIMGRSVRTEHAHYTEWPDGTAELYDHDHDPNEWHNLVNDPAHAEMRTRLKTQLRAMPSLVEP